MGHDDRERQFEQALARHLRAESGNSAEAHAADAASNMTADCLDTDTIAAYHDRMLSQDEMVHAKKHIAACARCQEILAALEVTDEVVLDAEHEKFLTALPVAAATFEHRSPGKAARADALPVTQSKSPRDISTGRRKPLWAWVAPAGALAAGLLVWVVTKPHFDKRSSSYISQPASVAQREASDGSVPAERDSNASSGNKPDAVKGLRKDSALDEPGLQKLNQPLQPYSSPPLKLAPGVAGELQNEGRSANSLTASRAKPALRLEDKTQLNEHAVAAPPPPPAGNKEANGKLIGGAAGSSASNADAKDLEASNAASDRLAASAETESGYRQQNLKKQKQEPPAPAAAAAAPAATPQSSNPPAPAAGVSQTSSAGNIVDKAAKKSAAPARQTVEVTTQAELTSRYEKAGTSTDLKTIVAPGGTVLWRLESGGKIARSSDSGTTWSRQNSGVLVELIAGSAPNDAVCWVVGRVGTILRTTDGGGHWNRVVSPIKGDVNAVQAEDAMKATVSGAQAKTFATTDGGLTWASVE
jgi:hypothetical protein